jgi:hypothetical protein
LKKYVQKWKNKKLEKIKQTKQKAKTNKRKTPTENQQNQKKNRRKNEKKRHGLLPVRPRTRAGVNPPRCWAGNRFPRNNSVASLKDYLRGLGPFPSV